MSRRIRVAETLTEELLNYLKQPIINQNEDPVHFWKKNLQNFKNIPEVSRRFLSIRASNCSSERINLLAVKCVKREFRNIDLVKEK